MSLAAHVFSLGSVTEPKTHPDRRRGRREQLGCTLVVQAGHRHPATQHAGLGGGVVSQGAVPVEVIFGDVEHDAGLGSHRRRPVQLEARQLDGQHVGRAVRSAGQDTEHRAADVAAQPAVEARGDEHRVQHRRSGGLAVGTGDRQPAPWRPVVAGLVEPPGQFDVTPNRDTGGRGGRGHRRGR